MTKCGAIVKDGHYQTFGEVMEKLVWTIGEFNKCSVRHDALVDYETKKVK